MKCKCIFAALLWSFVSCKPSHSSLKQLESEDSTSFEDAGPTAAQAQTRIPFPKEVSHIYYFEYDGGMQIFDMYCRFTCSESDAEKIINELLDMREKRSAGAPSSLPRVFVTSPPFQTIGCGRHASLKWWDLQSANVVKAFHPTTPRGYHLWEADLKNGTVQIYFSESD